MVYDVLYILLTLELCFPELMAAAEILAVPVVMGENADTIFALTPNVVSFWKIFSACKLLKGLHKTIGEFVIPYTYIHIYRMKFISKL